MSRPFAHLRQPVLAAKHLAKVRKSMAKMQFLEPPCNSSMPFILLGLHRYKLGPYNNVVGSVNESNCLSEHGERLLHATMFGFSTVAANSNQAGIYPTVIQLTESDIGPRAPFFTGEA